MRAPTGWFKERVTIQARSTDQDELGQPIETWTTVATVWASVNDVSGREYVAAGGVQNSALTKILIRYRPSIVAAMRVIHGADMYNIEAVLGQDRISLMLMCKRFDA